MTDEKSHYEPESARLTETPCPAREDQMHCNCWYDGGDCCACGDPAIEGSTPNE